MPACRSMNSWSSATCEYAVSIVRVLVWPASENGTRRPDTAALLTKIAKPKPPRATVPISTLCAVSGLPCRIRLVSNGRLWLAGVPPSPAEDRRMLALPFRDWPCWRPYRPCYGPGR